MKPKTPIFFPALSCIAFPVFKGTEKLYESPNLTKDLKFYNEKPIHREEQYLYHPYTLWSAAHYYKRENFREELQMDDKSLLFLDSGGFQLETGKAPKGFTAKKSLEWCEKHGNLYPILDQPVVGDATKKSFNDALDFSCDSAKYYYENRTNTKSHILNVISGRSLENIDDWYKKISQWKFDGWAHGGNHQGNLKSILYGVFYLLNKGEFHSDTPKYYHILGVSANISMFYFALIQRELNKLDGVNIQLTYDASSFALVTSYGKVYSGMSYRGTEVFVLSNRYDYSSFGNKIPSQSSVFENPLVDTERFLKDKTALYGMMMVNNLWWTVQWKRTVDALVNCGSEEVLDSWIKTSEVLNNVNSIKNLFKNPKSALKMIGHTITDKKSIKNSIQSLDSFF